uniref:Uncharacterized protein n=1 Tax=Physcomitrium patens TaxID=3218 RepID=A0A2K1JRC9_PHYPA|nr:hypothetical protein PHYPA_016472 [Physcomitrium patens]
MRSFTEYTRIIERRKALALSKQPSSRQSKIAQLLTKNFRRRSLVQNDDNPPAVQKAES